MKAWLHRTFPILVTALRELHEEIAAKTRKIQTAQIMSVRTGRSVKRLWREQKEREANPEAFADESDSTDEDETDDDAQDEAFEPEHPPRPGANATPAARDIYRRLVQRLHPDRGGAWTTAREHLWHEVQQAWAAADIDWLSRLESEWEGANEVVGPSSPLSRLRRSIDELHAARRDLERKLRDYRSSPQWRFTLLERKPRGPAPPHRRQFRARSRVPASSAETPQRHHRRMGGRLDPARQPSETHRTAPPCFSPWQTVGRP